MIYEDEREDYECCDRELLRSKRGDTLAFQVQIYRPYPFQNSPQDCTGWFVQFTAKRQYADQDAQAVATSKTTGTAPNIITFPQGVTTGLAQISVGPLNTITLGDGPTRLVYDVQVIDPVGNVTTVEEGIWTVRPDVTRATSAS